MPNVDMQVDIGPLEPPEDGRLVMVIDMHFPLARRVREEERLRLSKMLMDTVEAWGARHGLDRVS